MTGLADADRIADELESQFPGWDVEIHGEVWQANWTSPDERMILTTWRRSPEDLAARLREIAR